MGSSGLFADFVTDKPANEVVSHHEDIAFGEDPVYRDRSGGALLGDPATSRPEEGWLNFIGRKWLEPGNGSVWQKDRMVPPTGPLVWGDSRRRVTAIPLPNPSAASRSAPPSPAPGGANRKQKRAQGSTPEVLLRNVSFDHGQAIHFDRTLATSRGDRPNFRRNKVLKWAELLKPCSNATEVIERPSPLAILS